MQKVAIVTDSIACLTKELVAQYDIEIVPLNFYCGDKLYQDWIDITPSEAYQLFLKDSGVFKSSAPSAGDYLDAFRRASNPDRDILCITLSAKLSTTYDAACVARSQAQTQLPHTSIEILDSQIATAAQGFIALAAARETLAGKNLAEVATVAKSVRHRVTLLAVMDTIRYVHRTGRIPKVASRLGSILNIRPIFTFNSGRVRLINVVRNKRRGIDQLLRIMKRKVGPNPVRVAVMHTYAQEEALRLQQRVASEFNCAELWLTEFSPLMGYACGTGTLGLAFYTEEISLPMR